MLTLYITGPASDVDLFLYGLNEEQAIEKIKQIEARVRDAILSETTVVRTKNAITICKWNPSYITRVTETDASYQVASIQPVTSRYSTT